MEHDPWVGRLYKDGIGIGRQRIAVIGHSHYGDNADFQNYAIGLIESCIHGGNEDFDGNMASFTPVPSYFGFENARDFWPRVIFFNFLPTLIGGSQDKFGYGSAEQIKSGCDRLLRILGKHEPSKVFVFSRKAWDCCPRTLEGFEHRLNERLGPDFIGFRGGNFGTAEAATMTFGLRHPMAANKERMRRVVKTLMEQPIEIWRDNPIFQTKNCP